MYSIEPIDLLRVLLVLTLLYLAYVDLRTFRLPDVITIPMIATGLILNGLFGSTHSGFVHLQDAIAGAAIGFASLWMLNLSYRAIKKQNGIGMGDAKLFSALGAWLGWSALPGILLIASISGLLGGFIWLRYRKQSLGAAFPFGPFLAIAGIIEVLWPQILQI